MNRFNPLLAAATALALAAATFVEKANPSAGVYSSWWFVALLVLVGIAAVAAIFVQRLWRRPPQLLVCAAVAVILLGGALTTWTAQRGSLTLHEGERTTAFTAADGSSLPLPFEVELRRFEVVNYPGTASPMDFVSHVVAEGTQADISMNHILRLHGYRFYQQGYDPLDYSSTLSVAHDPLGIAVTYAGYALLLAGLLWAMASRHGRFRRLLRGGALALLLVAARGNASAAPRTIPRDVADRMGRMYILYQGRICPVQTFAKDFTTKLTGSPTYRGLSPEQVLAGWLFYFDDWAHEPMIKIKGADVRAKADATGRRVTLRQLAFLDNMTLTPDPADKNLRAAAEKYNLPRQLVGGTLLKIFPLADSAGNLGWYTQRDALPLALADDEYLFIRRHLGYCQELVLAADWETLGRVFDKTRLYQQKHLGPLQPPPHRERAERAYNRLSAGRWLPMLGITLGLMAFALALAGKRWRWLRWAEWAWVSALTAFLLLLFLLRWVAGGHAPMAGGFDSMNLMAIGLGVAALLLGRRHRVVLPAAMLTMGFCLLVAMMSGSNPPVSNLMPVLNSPLLTLHVAVVMCAYALFLFAMAVGVAGLIADAARHARLCLVLLYPAVALLALGIAVGAVWANVSWGNYWSWDPKEVWALITLVVYSIPLWADIPPLRRPRVLCAYCVVAFATVIITYFGVSLLLGGAHAYN